MDLRTYGPAPAIPEDPTEPTPSETLARLEERTRYTATKAWVLGIAILCLAAGAGMAWRIERGVADNRAGIAALDARVTALDDRMDGFDARMDRLERKVDSLDRKLDAVLVALNARDRG